MRLLLSFLLLFVICTQQSAANNQSGWRIAQRCDLSGELTVQACARGLRIDDKKGEFTIFASPPKWTVQVYNNMTKVYGEVPIEHFRASMFMSMVMFTGRYLDDIPLVPSKKVVKFGLPSMCYGSTAGYVRDELRLIKERTGDTIEPAQVRAIYTEAMGLPPQVGFILARKYGLPHLKGIPLVMNYETFERTQVEYLSTFSCAKASVNVATPKGYKCVKSIERAIGGGASDEVLEEFSKSYHWSGENDLIFGKDSAKNKKKPDAQN